MTGMQMDDDSAGKAKPKGDDLDMSGMDMGDTPNVPSGGSKK
jgi:hypothetical protein